MHLGAYIPSSLAASAALMLSPTSSSSSSSSGGGGGSGTPFSTHSRQQQMDFLPPYSSPSKQQLLLLQLELATAKKPPFRLFCCDTYVVISRIRVEKKRREHSLLVKEKEEPTGADEKLSADPWYDGCLTGERVSRSIPQSLQHIDNYQNAENTAAGLRPVSLVEGKLQQQHSGTYATTVYHTARTWADHNSLHSSSTGSGSTTNVKSASHDSNSKLHRSVGRSGDTSSSVVKMKDGKDCISTRSPSIDVSDNVAHTASAKYASNRLGTARTKDKEEEAEAEEEEGKEKDDGTRPFSQVDYEEKNKKIKNVSKSTAARSDSSSSTERWYATAAKKMLQAKWGDTVSPALVVLVETLLRRTATVASMNKRLFVQLANLQHLLITHAEHTIRHVLEKKPEQRGQEINDLMFKERHGERTQREQQLSQIQQKKHKPHEERHVQDGLEEGEQNQRHSQNNNSSTRAISEREEEIDAQQISSVDGVVERFVSELADLFFAMRPCLLACGGKTLAATDSNTKLEATREQTDTLEKSRASSRRSSVGENGRLLQQNGPLTSLASGGGGKRTRLSTASGGRSRERCKCCDSETRNNSSSSSSREGSRRHSGTAHVSMSLAVKKGSLITGEKNAIKKTTVQANPSHLSLRKSLRTSFQKKKRGSPLLCQRTPSRNCSRQRLAAAKQASAAYTVSGKKRRKRPQSASNSKQGYQRSHASSSAGDTCFRGSSQAAKRLRTRPPEQQKNAAYHRNENNKNNSTHRLNSTIDSSSSRQQLASSKKRKQQERRRQQQQRSRSTTAKVLPPQDKGGEEDAEKKEEGTDVSTTKDENEAATSPEILQEDDNLNLGQAAVKMEGNEQPQAEEEILRQQRVLMKEEEQQEAKIEQQSLQQTTAKQCDNGEIVISQTCEQRFSEELQGNSNAPQQTSHTEEQVSSLQQAQQEGKEPNEYKESTEKTAGPSMESGSADSSLCISCQQQQTAAVPFQPPEIRPAESSPPTLLPIIERIVDGEANGSTADEIIQTLDTTKAVDTFKAVQTPKPVEMRETEQTAEAVDASTITCNDGRGDGLTSPAGPETAVEQGDADEKGVWAEGICPPVDEAHSPSNGSICPARQLCWRTGVTAATEAAQQQRDIVLATGRMSVKDVITCEKKIPSLTSAPTPPRRCTAARQQQDDVEEDHASNDSSTLRRSTRSTRNSRSSCTTFREPG